MSACKECDGVIKTGGGGGLYLPQSGPCSSCGDSGCPDCPLFQSPVPEDNAVGRTILPRVLGPSPIDFGKPVFNFRDNKHLSALFTQGVTPVVWECKLKPSTHTVLNPIDNEGQEILLDFFKLGASCFIPAFWCVSFLF